MKTNNIKLLSIVFLSLLAFSCGKDDEPTPEPTVQELATETGRWYLQYVENEIMDDCYKTTYYEFDGDIVTEVWFYTDDASGDCLAGFSETNDIEWVSDTQFKVLDDDYPYEHTIHSITETEMNTTWKSGTSGETKEINFDKIPGEE